MWPCRFFGVIREARKLLGVKPPPHKFETEKLYMCQGSRGLGTIGDQCGTLECATDVLRDMSSAVLVGVFIQASYLVGVYGVAHIDLIADAKETAPLK